MPLADTYKASRMFTADYHGIFQLIVNPKYWKMHGRMFVFNSTGSRGVRAVKEAADVGILAHQEIVPCLFSTVALKAIDQFQYRLEFNIEFL